MMLYYYCFLVIWTFLPISTAQSSSSLNIATATLSRNTRSGSQNNLTTRSPTSANGPTVTPSTGPEASATSPTSQSQQNAGIAYSISSTGIIGSLQTSTLFSSNIASTISTSQNSLLNSTKVNTSAIAISTTFGTPSTYGVDSTNSTNSTNSIYSILSTLTVSTTHGTSLSVSVSTSITTTTPSSNNETETGLTKTQVAGLAAGITAALIFILLIMIFIFIKRPNRSTPAVHPYNTVNEDNVEMADATKEAAKQ